jgi:prepilin-type N-terminal cleavage/methylation domain-containing protein
MNKNFRNNSKLFGRRQNGFTLVEMLIVILVLGILVAAIVPNLSRFTSQGVVEVANSELTTIKHTVMAYQSDHSGDFPCSTQPTAGSPQTILIAGGTGIAPYLSASNVVGTYTVDVDGTVKGITYTGLAWDDVNLRWKKA